MRAFGDEGIRSFVISEITPALNGKINYWLQFLLDNKIHISFNNQLEERIEKFHGGDSPFVYNSLSGGEHQRIDLAISFAFANIMTLTSGTCPSIVMLDEVGTNLDRPGVYAVYKTICELAKDRQVLITTHHPELQELLSAHDIIEVVMEKGFTTIRN
jgi:DNA repair exonuclease SbcCD ATPase subunit